ncbi:MAG: hypothetical protein IJ228_11020 [Succinivibrio sp.]|nr:hypothetical protein [Succinivibrio sp.]
MIELLDAHDVGGRIKVKESKLREMVAKGEFPKPMNLSSTLPELWPEAAVDKWILDTYESQTGLNLRQKD